MSSSSTVVAQAELMEKEKNALEHQQRVDSIESTIKAMSSRQVKLKITSRRNDITISELAKLKPGHTVYQGVGRAFLKRPVNELIEMHQEEKEKNEAEYTRLVNEKQRAADALIREERDLKKALDDYRAGYELLAAQQQQQAASGKS